MSYNILTYRAAELSMVQDEKLKKICEDFSLLNEDQQDYVLGILQALVFAKSSYNQGESDNYENGNSNRNP
ncbi:MAG: hypothetical protein FWC19_06100 [Treponema sp.]|nr:hypothetical protein [Treponema sp.]MCL2272357.1 hypothetical protein [Treponema sp.]